MLLLIATDAAAPQIDGVVRSYERLTCELLRRNVDVRAFSNASLFRSIAKSARPTLFARSHARGFSCARRRQFLANIQLAISASERAAGHLTIPKGRRRL
jgi:hypothetical protein